MYPFQHGGTGGQGAGHGFLDEVHGPGGGLGEGLSPEKAAQEDGGEEVAGAEELPRLLAGHGEADLAAAGVQTAGAQGLGGQADAGDDHGALPAQGEAAEPLLDAGLAGGDVVEGLPQEEGGLGEVGGDEVGLGGQLDHLLTHLGGVGAVDPAVVPHDGVDEDQGLLPAEALDETAEDPDLLRGAQKAGVDGVEGGVEGLPVPEGLLHGAGEVLEGGGLRGGEGGVGGEDRRGQGTALGAHDGEDRQDHREGAAAQTGQVLDGGHLGCAIHGIPPMRPPIPAGATRHSCPHDTTFRPGAQLTFFL